MITATAKCSQPDDVLITITMTMTAGEWRELVKGIPARYPGWPVAEAIGKAVDAFTQTHIGAVEVAP